MESSPMLKATIPRCCLNGAEPETVRTNLVTQQVQEVVQAQVSSAGKELASYYEPESIRIVNNTGMSSFCLRLWSISSFGAETSGSKGHLDIWTLSPWLKVIIWQDFSSNTGICIFTVEEFLMPL